MKAQMIWHPEDAEHPEVLTVLVSPTELSTLRAALALPPEQLVNSVAQIRTCADGRVIGRRPYFLRLVESITPLHALKTQQKDTGSTA
jgi:hypothetical protein